MLPPPRRPRRRRGGRISLENADADEAGLDTHIHEDLADDPDPGTAAGGIDPPETYLVLPGKQPVTAPVPDVDPPPADAELDEFARALKSELERRGRV